ncbi:MAG TPA: ABC transporter, partial [Bacillota bacterium]|nr:ABC transporter [Bacillota bacterium]
MDQFIEIKGARIHNLKNIDIRIPRNRLTVITGVSGSGKSSLAFDTLYEEGKRRYLLFSGTQFMVDSTPSFESITGLSPTVAVEQRTIRQSNPRSTVGTRTKMESLLAILYASYGNRGPAGASVDAGASDDAGGEDFAGARPSLPMEMFLKNSPKGMCAKCLGSGIITQIDEQRLFGNDSQPLNELIYGVAKRGMTRKMLAEFCALYGLTPSQPLSSLNEEQLFKLKYGDGGRTSFPGYVPWISQFGRSRKGRLRYLLTRDKLMNEIICPKCKGAGLGEEALHTTIGGKTITELEKMEIKDLRLFFKTQLDSLSGRKLIAEILTKLECMIDVGLYHLALSRPVLTLSGGEIQRLFLASFIITEMDSLTFIFDEPTIGLHEVEKEKLIAIIKNL